MPALPKWSAMGRRERFFVIGAAAALLLVLFDRGVFHPWGERLRGVRHEMRALERTLETQRQFLLRKDYVSAEAEHYRKYLRPAGPRDLEIASLLKELEGLGRQAGVSLGEVKPVPVD